MPLQTAPKKEIDPIDYLRETRNVLEKRVRNLEKKRNKLDVYKVKSDKGEPLNEDQTKAVERLDGVQKQIEIVQELLTNVTCALDSCEKSGKKKEKRDKFEKDKQDASSFAKLTEIQVMLQEVDTFRTSFTSGDHGAVLLTEHELELLDELFKILNPTREAGETGATLDEKLKQTGDFIVLLLEGRDRPSTIRLKDNGNEAATDDANGTNVTVTYKELKQLVEKVLDCAFFTGPKVVIETDTAEFEEEEPQVVENEEIVLSSETSDVKSASLVNGRSEIINETPVVETFPESAETEGLGTNGADIEEEEEEEEEEVAPPVVQRTPASWSEVAAADGDKKHNSGLTDMIHNLQSNYTFVVESHLDSTTPTNASPPSHPQLNEISAAEQTSSPKGLSAASEPIPVPAKKSNWADDAEITGSGSWADEPLPTFDAHSPAAPPPASLQSEKRAQTAEVDIFASASQSDYLQSGGDDEDGGGSWQQQHPRSSGHRGSGGGRGGYRRDRERGGSQRGGGFRVSRGGGGGGGYRGRGGWNNDRGGSNDRGWNSRGGGGYRGGGSSFRGGGGGGGNYRGYRQNFEYSAASGNSYQ